MPAPISSIEYAWPAATSTSAEAPQSSTVPVAWPLFVTPKRSVPAAFPFGQTFETVTFGSGLSAFVITHLTFAAFASSTFRGPAPEPEATTSPEPPLERHSMLGL